MVCNKRKYSYSCFVCRNTNSLQSVSFTGLSLISIFVSSSVSLDRMDSLRVVSLEIRGDAWYLNMGNRYLETEIKNADKADTELYKTWFEIALLLYGLSIKKALDLEKDFEETDIVVNLALKAISPTIIPVLRSLPNLKL